jgi:hypothetical protein
MENEDVTFEALFAPHAKRTAERCVGQKTVLVAHDSTAFSFPSEGRDGLGPVNSVGHRFLGHFSIALSADGKREPLGTLAVKTWARLQRGVSTKVKSGELSVAEARKPPRESARWLEGVEASEAQLDEWGVSAIHLMDSDGDDYLTLAKMAGNERRFVVRGFQNRFMQTESGLCNVKEFIATSRVQVKRSVKLSARKKQLFKQESRRRAQRREGREAQLAMHAERVDVRRPNHVRETVPDTLSRWTVEEFFKALKTGCFFEKRQLESLHTLENALALFIPMAWGLLRLRVIARDYPDVSADLVLTKTQITILRRKKLLTAAKPSAQEAILAVAALGGHITNNGAPGWLVLGRGYDDLLILEAGFLLASQKSDQS